MPGGDEPRSYYVGVDVGTGSVRAALVDQRGTLLAFADQPINQWEPQFNHHEQSSEDIWAACCVVSKKVVQGVNLHQIRGLGFDATCSLVVLDKQFHPLPVNHEGDSHRNIIMWLDHRAVSQVHRINETKHSVLQYVGGVMSVEMQAPKLLWLKENGDVNLMVPSRYGCMRKFRSFGNCKDFKTPRWSATLRWDLRIWISNKLPGGADAAACRFTKPLANPPANARDIRDTGLIPGSGRSPGGGNVHRVARCLLFIHSLICQSLLVVLPSTGSFSFFKLFICCSCHIARGILVLYRYQTQAPACPSLCSLQSIHRDPLSASVTPGLCHLKVLTRGWPTMAISPLPTIVMHRKMEVMSILFVALESPIFINMKHCRVTSDALIGSNVLFPVYVGSWEQPGNSLLLSHWGSP
ncbi:hypothetical protein FD754_007576 [Muntiacus muntjak]|uniref:Carbohydrate kinase FGGY N-terminal domain-containing protein n=1 Tax=Muntiacus muntjak TaxID=9888 RepID=A0A5N3WNP5_MUNMU|nr:hypothetical protein FD754_007576 [Muntiacus muntjak]